jgi:hypothetical protein
MKVLRNTQLKGVISKERALKFLGLELRVQHQVGNVVIDISRDDMGDINIDYIEDGEPAGGEFEEI